MARDYNRGLHPVVRWAHIAAAATASAARPRWLWLTDPSRRHWAAPTTLALALFVVVHPFDGAITRWVTGARMGGDVRRELEAWQQYGGLGSLIFAATVIWLLDPARRRRLLDLLAASVAGLAAYTVLKVLIGRPRPKFGEADVFLLPFGEYPISVDGKTVLTHSWQGPAWRTAELWSMPSSHTMAAMVLSVFLARTYPRLRWLPWAMVAIVGTARVVTGAHWATDVIVGAAMGYIVGHAAVAGRWGDRAVEWVWGVFVREKKAGAETTASA